MANFQAPIITKLYWGGFDLQNLMYVLYKHFDTNPTSLFTPSLQTEITTNSLGPGTYSFLLTPEDVGETWQLNFRNIGSQVSPNSTTVNLGIDPQATIVDSSLGPPSSDSEFSGETTAFRVSFGADSDGTAFVLEFPDAVCVLLPSGATDPWQIPNGFLAGRVWSAPFANDPSLGRDGLAILGHIPRISINDVGLYWLTSDASSVSLFRHGTDSWTNQVAAGLDAASALPDWIEEGAATSPGPIPLTTNGRILGVMKYLSYMAPVQTPLKVIKDNKGVQRYLTLQTDVAGAVIPWDDTIVPTQHITDGPGVATYADLPTVGILGGDFERVITGTAQGVYQYVAEVGGDSFGMWLPSDYASRITDYVRDSSGNPCKVSMPNGVGSDTRAILTGRGWTADTTGDASITDTSGDLELLGGTSDSNYALLQFDPSVGTLNARQVFWVISVDVLSASGGWRSASLLIRGNTSTHWSVMADCALGAVPNKFGFINSSVSAQVGQGSVSFTPFSPLFGELASGWTTLTGSPIHRVWDSNVGQSVGDSSALVNDVGGTTSGYLIFFYAFNTGGTQPQVRLREFHLFQLEG